MALPILKDIQEAKNSGDTQLYNNLLTEWMKKIHNRFQRKLWRVACALLVTLCNDALFDRTQETQDFLNGVIDEVAKRFKLQAYHKPKDIQVGDIIRCKNDETFLVREIISPKELKVNRVYDNGPQDYVFKTTLKGSQKLAVGVHLPKGYWLELPKQLFIFTF